MPAYIVAQIKITDRAEYANYESGFMDIFAKYNGSMLSVDEAPHLMEGDWPYTRSVLISFPSKADALAWYESADYQALAKRRFAASAADIVLIQGIEND